MRIAVDVDGVLVESGEPWIDWLAVTYEDVIPDPVAFKTIIMASNSWNLETLIHPFIKDTKSTVNIWDYWKNPELYDSLKPIKDAVKAHQLFLELGHEPYFVSSCFIEHYESKKRFLIEHFGSDRLINCSTQYKYLIGCDVIIDDCPQTMIDFLHNTSAQCIQYITPFKQLDIVHESYPNSTRLRTGYNWDYIMEDWAEISSRWRQQLLN